MHSGGWDYFPPKHFINAGPINPKTFGTVASDFLLHTGNYLICEVEYHASSNTVVNKEVL